MTTHAHRQNIRDMLYKQPSIFPGLPGLTRSNATLPSVTRYDSLALKNCPDVLPEAS